MQIDIIRAAKYYMDRGFSVLPTKADKAPAVSGWTQFQSHALSIDEMSLLLDGERVRGIGLHGSVAGLGLVCGKISGNLEVIDIDAKYDLTGTLIDNIRQRCEDHCSGLYDKLYQVRTRSGGIHLYYRCPEIQGSKKLAQRPATEAEKDATYQDALQAGGSEESAKRQRKNDRVRVLIETRGEGGFIVAPPTPGYTRLTGFHIPIITTHERMLLHDVMSSFNEVQEQQRQSREPAAANTGGLTPWDDFNARYDHFKLLEGYGWRYCYTHGNLEKWLRPGKRDGTSATFFIDSRIFYCWSTSTELTAERGYTLAALFTEMECGGDFSKSGKTLYKLGYGDR